MNQKTSAIASSTNQKDALLEAATTEFAAHGFEATSIQKIASAAGVSKAKVFYYFDSKEELYAQVLDRTLRPCSRPSSLSLKRIRRSPSGPRSNRDCSSRSTSYAAIRTRPRSYEDSIVAAETLRHYNACLAVPGLRSGPGCATAGSSGP